MAFRLYLVPSVGDGSSSANARRPKYFADGQISPAPVWSGLDYGFEPAFIVGSNLTPSAETFVTGQADVTDFPSDLDAGLQGGQVNALKSELEAFNIPAAWITGGMTWRAIARTVLNMFAFMGRYGVVYANANGTAAPPIFGGAITLNSTFGDLSATVQSAILATAADLELSTAGLTSGTSIRSMLKSLSDQTGDRSYDFNGNVV